MNELPKAIKIIPKLNNFLITFIIFSLPGFVTAIVWLLISIVIFFNLIFFSNNSNQRTLDLNLISNSSASVGILVYELTGEITSSLSSRESNLGTINIDRIREDFKLIKENKNIKNVVFKMNTPGGGVFSSFELGSLITDITKYYSQESVFYFDQIVASGGLIASYSNPNNYVIANEFGETGSIGVFIAIPNLKEAGDNFGYKEVFLRTGNLKGSGSLFQDTTSEELTYFQETMNKHFQDFKDIVQKGRNLDNSRIAEISNGDTFFNSKAKDLGLVDEIGSLDRSITKAAENVNLSEYKVWSIKQEASLFESFLGSKNIDRILNQNLSSNITKQVIRFQPGQVYAIDRRWSF